LTTSTHDRAIFNIFSAIHKLLIFVYVGVRFWPKVGQIVLKWDKSGTLSDQISNTFWLAKSKCTEIYLKKKVRNCPILGQSDPVWAQFLPGWSSMWYFLLILHNVIMLEEILVISLVTLKTIQYVILMIYFCESLHYLLNTRMIYKKEAIC